VSTIRNSNIFSLIYIVSLTIQSVIDVTINNQCTDIELASSAYFTKDATCHMHLPQKVDSNHIMKANFMTGIDRDTFGGVLLYHLQRKENASVSTQLLMIWGYKSYGFYFHTLLIEHESALVWSKDRLKRLYDLYNSQYDIKSSVKIWLLNDNTELKTVCETSHGGFEVELIISEEKAQFHLIRPLCIDSNG
jgi:hypothetical protein